MANQVFYSNVAQQTALSGSISSGAVNITVDATTGFPGSFPYTLALDYGAATEELVSVTNAAGTSLTVTRGYGGTSAQSHSLGAVVRHVVDATDLTAFRTHEAATAAVHGVAGTLVGTSDTQTLSNKTLTSPTINGGALSGTFTGTPTFSGNATFNGEIDLNQLLRATRGLVTDSQFETRVSGDTNARWFMLTTGEQRWGPGNTGYDLSLQRVGVGQGQLNGILAVSSSNTGVVDHLLVNTASGVSAASKLLNLKNNGTSKFSVAPDGTTAVSGGLSVTGTLQAGNIYTGPQDPWTPTWSTSTGAHLPSFGNATINGYFSKVGRMVMFSLRITFGSTTNFGSGATGADNWRFSLPQQAARTSDLIGWFATRPGGSNSVMGSVTVCGNDATMLEMNIDTGNPAASAISNIGTVDSISPHTWAANDTLILTGFYEANT